MRASSRRQLPERSHAITSSQPMLSAGFHARGSMRNSLELDGQRGLRGEEGVHARRVGLEVRARRGVHLRDDALGLARDAERAHELVDLEGALAEEFRELPVGHAALELHLPQPILRVGVAHGEPAVALALREDVRHALPVAHDLHRRREPLPRRRAVELWQRAHHPRPHARRREDDGEDQRDEDPEDDLQGRGADLRTSSTVVMPCAILAAPETRSGRMPAL